METNAFPLLLVIREYLEKIDVQTLAPETSGVQSTFQGSFTTALKNAWTTTIRAPSALV